MSIMKKYENEKWIILTVPKDIYELAVEGGKLRGISPEEFVIEAVELAIEEEKRKREK